jgi:hypothetical protein
MALTFKGGPKGTRFAYEDGSMTVSWALEPGLTDDELADRLRRIVTFYDLQTGREELPQRIPGMALGMTQEQYPSMTEVMPGTSPKAGNGWAPYAGAALTPPEIPEGAEYELMPKDEQG